MPGLLLSVAGSYVPDLQVWPCFLVAASQGVRPPEPKMGFSLPCLAPVPAKGCPLAEIGGLVCLPPPEAEKET